MGSIRPDRQIPGVVHIKTNQPMSFGKTNKLDQNRVLLSNLILFSLLNDALSNIEQAPSMKF